MHRRQDTSGQICSLYISMYINIMAKKYSIAEARTNLPSIVDEAEAGREIQLTRRGKAVAVVVSLREFQRLRSERSSFGAAYKQFLATHRLDEVGLVEPFLEADRDRSTGRSVAL